MHTLMSLSGPRSSPGINLNAPKGNYSVQSLLIWFELFLSLALIVAILIHPAKGMGLGSMGGSAQIFGSQKGAETGLNRVTAAILILWMGTALLLASPLIP